MKKETQAAALEVQELHATDLPCATEFESSVLAAANKQANQILAKAQQDAAEKYNALINENKGDAVAAYQTNAQAALRRKTASAKQQNRQKLLVYRNQLVNGIFAEVEENLLAFCNTAAYATYLSDSLRPYAESAAACGTVRVKPADLQHADALKKLLPACQVVADNTIRIGGVKLAVGRILYDETLDDKLRSQRTAFLTRCGLRVE